MDYIDAHVWITFTFLDIRHTRLKLVTCPTNTSIRMFVIENGTLYIVCLLCL